MGLSTFMNTTKKCTRCNETKELTEFSKHREGKNGLRPACKACCKAYNKKWNFENREARRAYKKQYDIDNRDKNQAYYQANKESIISRTREWYEANKDYKAEYDKVYQEENKERLKAQGLEYRKNNKDIIQAKWTERYRNDIEFRITDNMRKRVRKALNGNSKSASTIELLGCTGEYFRDHLKQQFTEGMTWDNIHVDHILPVSAFNMKLKKHQKYAFHWSNCQPLFAVDNMSKNDKYCPDELAAYLKSKLPTPSL